MTTLLGRLLMWLGALGCPVVLLSATLPNARREDLLRAYAEGTGHALSESEPLPTVPYPRLSWVEDGVAGATAITGVSPRSTKRVRVPWIDGTVPEEGGADFPLGELLAKKLENGGCAAVICNTVARAQAVYRALQQYFPDSDLACDGSPVLDLLHSRYRFMERQRREQRTLLRFGKPGDTVEVTQNGAAAAQVVNRPWRAVLVATQIIEQSLDLDFDLMITDLAPADLVLQRLGRLHRHDRSLRPTGDDCILYLCRPLSVSPDGVPIFEKHFDRIYDAHILLRSWLTLRDRTGLFVPGDVEGIIENVYGENIACPNDASEALRAWWSETAKKRLREHGKHERMAMQRAIPTADEPDYFEAYNQELPDDAPETSLALQGLTRLSDVNVSAVLLYPDEARQLMGRKPGKETAHALLMRSAPITNAYVASLLIADDGPQQWKDSSLLRHHRYIPLDEHGEYRDPNGKFTLHYGPMGVALDIE